MKYEITIKDQGRPDNEYGKGGVVYSQVAELSEKHLRALILTVNTVTPQQLATLLEMETPQIMIDEATSE